MKRWLLFALIAVVLGSCGEPTPPTIGPIQIGGGNEEIGTLSLSATTNCAVLGETITFTLRVANTADYSLQFSNPPLFDMTIRKPNGLEIRWSDTDQYPIDINPVMSPGEVREYQWTWMPTIEGALTLSILTAALPQGDTTPNANNAEFAFGVNWMSWDVGGSAMPIACSELKR